jgi:hypothetical protein
MDTDVLKELESPFKLKAREGVGGKVFKYVPSEDIVNRMNKVFEGNWSTEVMSSEIVEDNVLMCVRVYVSVNTQANSEVYYHDGYASHPLARYGGGANQGKIIDVGNSYRSAASKAIKTACTRWGVALYLEGSDNPIDEKAGAPKTVLESAAPLDVKASPDIPQVITPTKTNPAIESSNVDSESVFTEGNVVPMENIESGPFNNQDGQNKEVVQGGPPHDEAVEKATLVQKAAIDSIMSTKSVKFDVLVAQALKRESNLPLKIEDVSYLDAITLIQYGNHLEPVGTY